MRITLSVWTIYVLFNIISCGVAVITPYIYSNAGSTFTASLAAYSSELLAIVLVVYIIDKPVIGGRIKVILYGLFLLIGVNLSIYFFKSKFLDVGWIL